MPLTYEAFPRRSVAFFLDWVWVCFLLIAAAMTAAKIPARWGPWLMPGAALAAGLIFAGMEGSAWQSSFGKRQMRMKVMEARGRRVTFSRALVRNLLKAGPWIVWPWLPAAWLYWWPAGWIALLAATMSAGRRRAWYDYLAGTAVIGVPEGA